MQRVARVSATADPCHIQGSIEHDSAVHFSSVFLLSLAGILKRLAVITRILRRDYSPTILVSWIGYLQRIQPHHGMRYRYGKVHGGFVYKDAITYLVNRI